jgi:hypothetical protein
MRTRAANASGWSCLPQQTALCRRGSRPSPSPSPSASLTRQGEVVALGQVLCRHAGAGHAQQPPRDGLRPQPGRVDHLPAADPRHLAGRPVLQPQALGARCPHVASDQ